MSLLATYTMAESPLKCLFFCSPPPRFEFPVFKLHIHLVLTMLSLMKDQEWHWLNRFQVSDSFLIAHAYYRMSCSTSASWLTAITLGSFNVPDHCPPQRILRRHIFPLATVTVVSRPFKYKISSDMRKRAFIMFAITSGCPSASFRRWSSFSAELRDKKVPIQILLNFDPKRVFFGFTVNNLLLFTPIGPILISFESKRCGQHVDMFSGSCE